MQERWISEVLDSVEAHGSNPDPGMKVSSESSGAGTHVSGIYAREGAREEVTGQPATPASADSPNGAATPNAKMPRGYGSLRTHLRGLGVLAALAVHAVWHTPATSLLLALSPLSMLLGRADGGKWAMRAAVAWLLLAVVEWAYPTAPAGSELRHLVTIVVLAVVLWRLQRARAVLLELTRRDPLTGLLNRRGFDDAATRELRRASRYARPLVFASIDIDRFKEANDRLGHGFGDRVLQIVAGELEYLRGSDLAARLGGDEFGVLMPETDELGAEQLLKRVQQRVQERTAERGWPMTLSVGIVGLDTLEQTHSLEAIVAEADRRMYRMKQARRAAIGGTDVVPASRCV